MGSEGIVRRCDVQQEIVFPNFGTFLHIEIEEDCISQILSVNLKTTVFP